MVMKIGVLLTREKLSEELGNGWNVVLAPDNPAGNYRVFFKDPSDKFKIPESLQRTGWDLWGYDGYRVSYWTQEEILKKLAEVFPGAQTCLVSRGNWDHIS